MTPKIVKRNHFAPLYWLLVARWIMKRRRHYDAKDKKIYEYLHLISALMWRDIVVGLSF